MGGVHFPPGVRGKSVCLYPHKAHREIGVVHYVRMSRELVTNLRWHVIIALMNGSYTADHAETVAPSGVSSGDLRGYGHHKASGMLSHTSHTYSCKFQ